MFRHFRLGLRDGAMAGAGFWLGLVALSNAVDIYHWGVRTGRHFARRRRGFWA